MQDKYDWAGESTPGHLLCPGEVGHSPEICQSLTNNSLCSPTHCICRGIHRSVLCLPHLTPSDLNVSLLPRPPKTQTWTSKPHPREIAASHGAPRSQLSWTLWFHTAMAASTGPWTDLGSKQHFPGPVPTRPQGPGKCEERVPIWSVGTALYELLDGLHGLAAHVWDHPQ